MPITINISGESASEVKQLAFDLAYTMGHMADKDVPVDTSVSTLAPAPVADQAQKQEKPIQRKSQAEVPQEEKPVQTDPGNETPSVVDLRAKAQEVSAKGQESKKAIKALLDKYESKSISAVPADKRAAFMAELEQL